MENEITENKTDLKVVPVLPLRDVVVYPYMVIPLFVGRDKSIKALEAATDGNTQILLLAQKDSSEDAPKTDALYETGTLANILQLLKLPDGTVKVLVEGTQRAKVAYFKPNEEFLEAEVIPCLDKEPEARESDVLMRTLLGQFEQYVKLNKKIPPEVLSSLSSIDEISRMADTVAAHMTLKLEDKQSLLEMTDVKDRVEKLMAALEGEIDIQQIEKRIRNRVKKQMEKSQREYYLNEQLKAVQKELGEMDDAANEADELSNKIEQAGMSAEVKDKVELEFKKLCMMLLMSAEATVVRNYIEFLLEVPWKKRSRVTLDLDRAEVTLDEDHYGLEKVKERIVEYLAV
jgi:ATP-dependent Lon protease